MLRSLSFAVLILAGPILLAQTITFQDPVSTEFKTPTAIVSADFNGDGKPDLAMADVAASTINIMSGKGDGTFGAPADFAPPRCGPIALYNADFTGDGNTDLLTFCANLRAFFVLPGKGDGTFRTPVATEEGSVPLSSSFLFDALSATLAIADFNGDGKLDVALATLDNNSAYSLTFRDIFQGMGHTAAAIMYGRGDGSFAPLVKLDIGSTFPISVAAGDLNGDGKLDLAIAILQPSGTSNGHLVSSLLIFYGDGKGNFTKSPQSLPAEMLATNIVVTDVNRDGKTDIILSGPLSLSFGGSSPAMGLVALAGDGAGGFHQTYAASANGYDAVACVLADLRGSGNLDLLDLRVTWTPGTVIAIGSQLVVHPGRGDGTFQPAVTIPLSQGKLYTALAGGDFDGDGRYDLALSHVAAAEASAAYPQVNSPAGALEAAGKLSTGVLDVLRNFTPPAKFTTVNGASFLGGSQASGSIVSAFGVGLSQSIASPDTLPLPTNLGGVTVNVKDAAGVTRPAPLFYVSPKQINFEIPDGTAAGQAVATISYPSVTVSQPLTITAVAPGVFNSQNLAVGNIVWVKGGQQQITSPVQADSTGNLVPVPIDVTSADQVFLVLYGTGIRNHAAPVTARVGTTAATVAYAGPQGVFVGEDQINIQLPASLKGAGLVDVTLTVDGLDSNPVRIQLQ